MDTEVPGQELSVQYSQCPPPLTWTPLESTLVEHQGWASPSIVVQLSWILLPKMNGKIQFPQLPVEAEVETDEPLVVVGPAVDAVVVGAWVVTSVVEAGQVLRSGIF